MLNVAMRTKALPHAKTASDVRKEIAEASNRKWFTVEATGLRDEDVTNISSETGWNVSRVPLKSNPKRIRIFLEDPELKKIQRARDNEHILAYMEWQRGSRK